MSLRSAYNTALAAVKTTTSNLVEWVNGSSSLPAVHDKLHDWIVGVSVAYCANLAALQALGSSDTRIAYLEGSGFKIWSASDAGGSPAATGGGFWNQYKTAADILFDSLGLMSTNDVPLFNTGLGKFTGGPATVNSLAWANVSNKPIITGTTNPAIAGNLTVGGFILVTGNIGAADISGYNITAANNVAIGAALSVTGAATTHGITNTGNVGTGTLSTTGAATVGTTLGVTGNVAVNTNKFNVTASNGNTAIAGTLDVTGAATVGFLQSAGIQSSAGLVVGGGPSSFDTYIGNPVWTTGTRPASRPQGAQGFNSTTHKLECWDGTAWNDLF